MVASKAKFIRVLDESHDVGSIAPVGIVVVGEKNLVLLLINDGGGNFMYFEGKRKKEENCTKLKPSQADQAKNLHINQLNKRE